MNIFRDKIAVVTGGSSGLGRSLCRQLANNGARVIIADIDHAGAMETAQSINTAGGTAEAVKLDVTDEENVKKILSNIAAEYGQLDYIFNNAAICITGEMINLDILQYKQVMDVNYFGVLHGTLAAYEIMVNQGFGHIINVSSMAGFAPFSINAPYTSSKYATFGLTASLLSEAIDYGVRVSLVCPGILKTEFYDNVSVVGASHSDYVSRLPARMAMDADSAAAKIIKGVSKNKWLIIFPWHARILWTAHRLFPGLINRINRKMVREFRSMSSRAT